MSDQNNNPPPDKMTELLVIIKKSEHAKALFEVLLEKIGLQLNSSKKEFFDRLLELHNAEQEALQVLGELYTKAQKPKVMKGKKTPGSGPLSVSN